MNDTASFISVLCLQMNTFFVPSRMHLSCINPVNCLFFDQFEGHFFKKNNVIFLNQDIRSE